MWDKRKINLEDWIVLWLWWPPDWGRAIVSPGTLQSDIWCPIKRRNEMIKTDSWTLAACTAEQWPVCTSVHHMHRCTLTVVDSQQNVPTVEFGSAKCQHVWVWLSCGVQLLSDNEDLMKNHLKVLCSSSGRMEEFYNWDIFLGKLLMSRAAPIICASFPLTDNAK